VSTLEKYNFYVVPVDTVANQYRYTRRILLDSQETVLVRAGIIGYTRVPVLNTVGESWN
jgi:hypothetical protein